MGKIQPMLITILIAFAASMINRACAERGYYTIGFILSFTAGCVAIVAHASAWYKGKR